MSPDNCQLSDIRRSGGSGLIATLTQAMGSLARRHKQNHYTPGQVLEPQCKNYFKIQYQTQRFPSFVHPSFVLPSRAGPPPPWILKQGGLESFGWILISLNGKTKWIIFWFRFFFVVEIFKFIWIWYFELFEISKLLIFFFFLISYLELFEIFNFLFEDWKDYFKQFGPVGAKKKKLDEMGHFIT